MYYSRIFVEKKEKNVNWYIKNNTGATSGILKIKMVDMKNKRWYIINTKWLKLLYAHTRQSK